MANISVCVFKPAGRKFFNAQWTDPVTGRKKTRSTGTDRRREADRRAAVIESELRQGRFVEPSKVTWQEFRQRYESESLTGKAEKTRGKAAAVFNAIERHIGPKRLAALDSGQISLFQQALRDIPLAESTIKGHLSHLKAALRWAKRQKLLAEVPEIDMPKRAKASKVMRGRPITGEEFERMLAVVPKALAGGHNPKRKKRYEPTIPDATIESWRHLLFGLWWSGLRLGESLVLTWDDDRLLRIDQSGEYPMIRIRAELEKGHKDRLLPIAPEFAEFLDATPADEQTGFVFNPLPIRPERTSRLGEQQVGRMIARFGKLAAIKVNERADGVIEFASAQDLRRSFGERWAPRVMPQVLMELMRHESIETTLKYYVGKNAEKTAAVLYAAVANKTANTPGFQPNRAGTVNTESSTW